MSPARTPMPPPALAGYQHVRLLGSGGYSDVFLYEQQLPRRQVAIKVLLAEGLGDSGRQQFYDEANAMAAVSTHPYIVTVLHADVSPEGHPFLVMEYYPHPNFSVRARNEQIPVAEVLRTGIQVASAVETAHRAGILHRDIKPANILTSEYNRPGLTDFGIASTTLGAHAAEGLSIPWAPPEVIDADGSPGVAADVYSLAATVYTLLAGRSPFEVPGGSNRTLDLMQRIDRGDPPPTGRADVPASLERLLRHGMSRSPHDRPSSALELGRMLQSVEIAEGWATTHLEIREDTRDVRPRAEEPSEDGTRLKSPTVVHGQGESAKVDTGLVTGVPGAAGLAEPPLAPSAPGQTVARDSPAAGVADGTMMRGAVGGAPITSGVGERPLGLSGVAPPRPVRPMPGPADASMESGPAHVTAAGGSLGSPRSPRRVKTAGVIAVVIAVALVAVALVMTAVSEGPEAECDPATEDCPEGETPPPPEPPVVPASPSDVQVSSGPGQTRIVSWIHETPDETDDEASYRILDTGSGQQLPIENATIDRDDEGRFIAPVPQGFNDCVRIIAFVGSTPSVDATGDGNCD